METTAQYRREIDGVRALAILPVVLFHAGFQTFSGGFVGVDVFFVISGYLITDHLYREARKGGIDIARFYERRVRRIFPALFFMCACTLIAGYFVMLPHELGGLATSALATTLFGSNFYFYFDSGYFAQAANYRPLLHTWSLAVEEQYYVFWPLLLWLGQRCWPRWILKMTVLLAAISLILSIAAIYRFESATFYMLPTRAWELLVGALIAISRWTPKRARDAFAWLGASMVVFAIVVYSEQTIFPGLAAVPPVLGSALIIAAAEGTSLGRILSTLPLRAIGLISYSLYLWHWPVLVFARLIYGPELPTNVAISCVLFATLAATFSWRFVEQPFRSPARQPKGTRGPLGAAVITMAVFSLVAITLFGGLPDRLPPHVAEIARAASKPNPNAFPCWVPQGANPDVASCLSRSVGNRKLVVLWGDSHTRPFAGPLAQRTNSTADIRVIGRGGCMPLADAVPARSGRVDNLCDELNRKVLEALVESRDVDTVILVGRWARLFFPEDSEEARRLVGESGEVLQSGPALSKSFGVIVKQLEMAGKRVVVLGDAPEFVFSHPECLARAIWLHTDVTRCRHASDTLPGSTSDITLRAIAERHPGVSFVWPGDVLCSGRRCLGEINGVPVSRDTDHLTDAAAGAILDATGLADFLSE